MSIRRRTLVAESRLIRNEPVSISSSTPLTSTWLVFCTVAFAPLKVSANRFNRANNWADGCAHTDVNASPATAPHLRAHHNRSVRCFILTYGIIPIGQPTGSGESEASPGAHARERHRHRTAGHHGIDAGGLEPRNGDRKSTRLNSSHANISYAVFCL